MKKKKRQAKIKELIGEHEIGTQDELAARLHEAGYLVTQATVSRDIREMRLSKIAVGGERQKYVLLGQDDEQLEEKYSQVLQNAFVSVETAQNMLVVKTVSGMAMAVAAALDAMKIKEVAGSIAGDDTIMIAARTVADAAIVRDRILELRERE
jgi:transcriptional regulator of arginine metabolism